MYGYAPDSKREIMKREGKKRLCFNVTWALTCSAFTVFVAFTMNVFLCSPTVVGQFSVFSAVRSLKNLVKFHWILSPFCKNNSIVVYIFLFLTLFLLSVFHRLGSLVYPLAISVFWLYDFFSYWANQFCSPTMCIMLSLFRCFITYDVFIHLM